MKENSATMFNSLIDTRSLREYIYNFDWVLIDCRFRLDDVNAGMHAYQQSHLPNARYAHLDYDLSGAPITDQGRHPLPTPNALNALFSRWGITPKSQVVAYDDMNGAIAARAWWLLRYMGHDRSAVLAGGWQAWLAEGFPTTAEIPHIKRSQFAGTPRTDWLVTIEQIPSVTHLIDSRAPARYHGEIEPLDPIAGHIPGAINYFFQQNWRAQMGYLPAEEIHAQLLDLHAGKPSEEAVFYCGSGVTACVNLLAQAYAGMKIGKLYAGSWSEWSTLGQPVAVG